MEDANSPQTQAWVRDQDLKAQAYLATVPDQAKLTARLHELYYADSVSLPQEERGRLFYKRTLAHREKPIFFWRSVSKENAERSWLDPEDLPNGEHVTVGEWVPSPDGAYVAYTTHAEGGDEAVLHVRDTARGGELDRDVIAGTNFADVSWSADSQGFYYMRLPMDPSIPRSERVAHADVRFHWLGRDAGKDLLVYPPTQDASQYLTPQASEDGKWLFITAAQGWTSTNIYYSDRPGSSSHFKPLFISTTAVASVAAWKDRFYLFTNQAASHGKILCKKPQENSWEVVVPERPDTVIESMHVVGGYVVLVTLKNAANRVEVYRPDGPLVWQIPLPEQGKIWDVSGKQEGDDLYIEFESFFVPPSIFHAHLTEKKLDVWETTQIPLDASRFKTDLVWYASKDGTPISMMVVQPRHLAHDGKAPLLLEGYGGFNTPILPRFSQEVLAWLEMGGIYAVPHLRGGGEYGEAWHQEGMLTHKQNTFDDFIAAAEFLIKGGYTQPGHLAIQGVSNGGLLVAAAMTQRPDLFRAVICKNPLTDMIRYPLFGEGKAWVPEYGSPDKEEEFKALLAYSPYHHVVAAAYPSLLMFAGEHDDRVDPMHARKFVAAIEAANTSKNPILFHLLKHSGHAGSDVQANQVKETAARLAFLKRELGLK